MTYFSHIALPQDLDDSADLLCGPAFLRRMDALQRETMAPPAAQTGLFVAGAKRKRLFQ